MVQRRQYRVAAGAAAAGCFSRPADWSNAGNKILAKYRGIRHDFIMSDHYELIESGDLLVIRVLIDTLDFYEISESANFLRNAIKERSFPSIVWDLTTVEFIDSSVFGFFIETHNVLMKNGRDITIVCRNKEVLNIMFMLKIHEIIRVFPALDAAITYLRSR